MDEKLEFFKRLDISDNISTIIEDTIVGIHIDNSLSENRYGQIMLEVAANLLSRIYTNVILSVPDKTVTLKYTGETVQIGTHIQNIAMNAREGNQDRIILSGDLTKCSAIISISEKNIPIQSSSIIYIAANGWLAGISPTCLEIGDIGDKNPCGAVAAACIGIAEIVKLAFKGKLSKPMKLLDSPLVFSTLDFKNNMPNPANHV